VHASLNRHYITIVSVQAEDVTVPAVTVAVLWQHRPALLWL